LVSSSFKALIILIVFLGGNINSENKVDEEITKRIMAGNHAYFSLRKLLSLHLLCKGTQMTYTKC
jgi:hypothetical protein